MAWIEFHGSKIKRLPKFKSFRRALQWSPNEALGFLGSFWSEVIELREDGDISKWSHEDIAEAGNTALDPERVWDALVFNEWIDARGGKVLVHDWLDTAGSFLRSKYGSGRRRNLARLREIWAIHGRHYGKEEAEDGQQDGREDGQPQTPNQPNQPNPYKRITDQLKDVGPEHRMPMADPPNIKATRETLKRFVRPTVEEIAAYCSERNNSIDPQFFFDSNEAKGWVVGDTKSPMKDWKAAIRTWEARRKDNRGSSPRNEGSLQPDFIFPGGAA